MARHDSRAALTSMEEAVLVRQAQSPHNLTASRAYARLEQHFKPLLRQYYRKVHCPPCDRGDVVQELQLAFLSAIRHFDPHRGVRLATYAATYLDGAVAKIIRARKKHRAIWTFTELSQRLRPTDNEGLHPEERIAPGGPMGGGTLREVQEGQPDFETIVEREAVREPVRSFIRSLSPSLQRIAVARYWEDRTPAETARHLGVSRPTIFQGEKRIAALAQQRLRGG